MMMIRLFWQPTYTDLTVSNIGLMGFLMCHIVTTMAMIAPLFTLFLPPHFRIMFPCPEHLSIRSPHYSCPDFHDRPMVYVSTPDLSGCAASLIRVRRKLRKYSEEEKKAGP